jgi:hypothetical protein
MSSKTRAANGMTERFAAIVALGVRVLVGCHGRRGRHRLDGPQSM